MNSKTTRPLFRVAVAVLAVGLLATACGSSEPGSDGQVIEPDDTPVATSTSTTSASAVGGSSFTAEVWADNWFALYVDGELVGRTQFP